MQAATEAEAEANEKRREEAGNVGSSDEWRWTLNWDDIQENIVVGSCPRTRDDLNRLADEAKIDAVLCLQSELCHDALQIDWNAIRDEAVGRGVIMTRAAVRDFDHNDQAAMLPEAVRMLYLLLSMGKRVYVHCTAGINRATLTVVGYLTFVQGWPLDDAVRHVKEKRPQAHPYIDCWKTVRARLTDGRTDELLGLAKAVYKGRQANKQGGTPQGDWAAAEAVLIKETFQRQLGCTLSLVSSLKEMQETKLDSIMCFTGEEIEQRHSEMDELRVEVEQERQQFSQVAQELSQAREEVSMLRQAAAAEDLGPEMLAELDALKSARAEIAALRTTIKQVALSTMTAVEGEAIEMVDADAHPAAFLEPGQPDAPASPEALERAKSVANAFSGNGNGSRRT